MATRMGYELIVHQRAIVQVWISSRKCVLTLETIGGQCTKAGKASGGHANDWVRTILNYFLRWQLLQLVNWGILTLRKSPLKHTCIIVMH